MANFCCLVFRRPFSTQAVGQILKILIFMVLNTGSDLQYKHNVKSSDMNVEELFYLVFNSIIS